MMSWTMMLNLQIKTVRKIAGMHPNEWVENADRLVAGFLEMFEEGCHKMVDFFYLSERSLNIIRKTSLCM